MCEQARTLTIEHFFGQKAEPLKIKLIKGQQSSYGWEISCAGSDMAEILSRVRAADAAQETRTALAQTTRK